MKLRHLILFFIACIFLIASDLSGGPLLAILAWLQVYALLTFKNFNKKSQIWALLIFLLSLPFVFFWGSIHALLFVYLTEKSLSYLIMAMLIDIPLSMIAVIYYIYAFDVAEKSDFQVSLSLKTALESIKNKKTTFFKTSCFLFIFSLIPFLHTDWKIVFAIMATHLFLKRYQLKQVYDSGF